MEKDLTKGKVWKTLLLFAFPIMGANLLQSMYGTVDLMIVGLFTNKCEVSAVSTGSMIMQTYTGIITGLTMGSTILIGHRIGMKDCKGAACTIASSFAVFIIIGVLLTAIIVLTAVTMAGFMNAPEEAFSQTVKYNKICGYGAIFIVLFNSVSGILRGLGDSKSPLILMLIACICNIAGDLLLVGYFGMGSSGAAIATVAAQAISVAAAFIIIRNRGFGFQCTVQDYKPEFKTSTLVLKYGFPIAAQEFLTGVSFMVILAVLNKFGVTASAGVGVGEKICGIIFIVPGAMMSAVSAFCAQNIGAGNTSRAKQGMFVSMVTVFTVGIFMFWITFTHGAALARLFTSDNDVCLAAADYLRSYSIDCLLVGFSFSMMGYLNGYGETVFVALQGILSTFLVRIPVSYFMSKIPGVSLFQVGLATPMATLFAIVLCTCYLIYFEKKRKRKGNIVDI